MTPTRKVRGRPKSLDRPGATLVIKLMSSVNTRVYRLTGGRLGRNWRIGAGFRKPVPVCLLTTTGRKSGRARTVPLCFLRDDDRIVLVASQGGLPTNPQWYNNIRANPAVEIEIGRRHAAYRARPADRGERARLWPALVDLYADYAAYQSWTEREIPVVICEPVDRSADPDHGSGRGVRKTGPTAVNAREGDIVSRNPYEDLPQVASFQLRSNDVADGQTLDKPHLSGVFGAGGDDVSPQLAWSGAPDGTQSYAVTMYDPDAPTASGFWHWAAFNIPANVSELASNASADGLPAGAVQLKNDGGTVGFIGAAPPPGDGLHHYWVVVHAVDVPSLDIPADATCAFLGFNLFMHTLGRATLVPTYEVPA